MVLGMPTGADERDSKNIRLSRVARVRVCHNLGLAIVDFVTFMNPSSSTSDKLSIKRGHLFPHGI
jgi:hypothetical protein